MTLTYFGHSAFQIETNGTTLLTDPFIEGNPHAEGVIKPGQLDPDVVLLTHAHGDHYGDTPGILERTGAQVVANFEIIQYISGELDHDNGHPMNTGGSWEFDWGTATMTYARHSSSFPDGTYGGNPNGFILELEGQTIYNTGDTCYFTELEWYAEEYDIDLLLLPIGDDFTMGPKEAVMVADILQPRLTVPMHYGTFPYLEVDVEGWGEMMTDVDLDVNVLDPGDSLEIGT